MGYMEKRWVSHNKCFIVQDKYHSQRMMPKNPKNKEKRKPRTGGTSEAQERINMRRSTEKLTRLILDNFSIGDWWVTFRLAEKVSVERFKKEHAKMIRRLRTFYQKHGIDLKYIAVHENLTGKGRLHGHIILPAIPGVQFMQMKKEMLKAWELGDSTFKPYEGAVMDARKLAAYMTKEELVNTKLNEKAQIAAAGGDVKAVDADIKDIMSKRSRICPSKNLIRTRVVKKQVKADTFRDEIKAPRGYHIVKPLTYNGWTEDGHAYQHAVFERDDE